jgi:hypothetical protein
LIYENTFEKIELWDNALTKIGINLICESISKNNSLQVIDIRCKKKKKLKILNLKKKKKLTIFVEKEQRFY